VRNIRAKSRQKYAASGHAGVGELAGQRAQFTGRAKETVDEERARGACFEVKWFVFGVGIEHLVHGRRQATFGWVRGRVLPSRRVVAPATRE
jgi:hypothetical protein